MGMMVGCISHVCMRSALDIHCLGFVIKGASYLQHEFRTTALQLEFSTYYCKEQSYLVVICNIQRFLEMTGELPYCRFVFGFVILPTLITCVFSRQ